MKKFTKLHPTKKDNLLLRLVVNASLPLYLVVHPDFKEFVKQLHPNKK